MEQLILQYGLIAVFLGAMVEESLAIVMCGVVAHMGLLDFPMALAVAAAGGFTTDVILFSLGRSYSATIRTWRAYRAVGPAVDLLAARLGPWQIAASRPMFGTRHVTMLFWGVRGLAAWRFVMIDLPVCLIWTALLGTLGYAASATAMRLLGEARRVETWILGAIAVFAGAFFVIRLVWARARRSAGELK